MSKPASVALFYSVLVSSAFIFGYFTNDWARSPEIDETELIERHVFANEYGVRMERWIAASFKVKMLTSISNGEPVEGFLEFALKDLNETIEEMKYWESKAPNEDFRNMLNTEIVEAQRIYEETKHNK
ncbi:MAG: hypothetical protein NXI15_09045 [Gammaproteobacteria bacterium]|nr:hypothetical protein [Gammaproteobacteria bacterium]